MRVRCRAAGRAAGSTRRTLKRSRPSSVPRRGVLGIDRRARFRVYAAGERRPSFALAGPLRVGTVLPEDGLVYYDVPPEFALPDYAYTVVNGHPVLVDPRSRRVVEVVD